jgi:hypothetical protein
MRRLIALALAGGLLIATMGPVQAKPTAVWEDAAGDAGNQDSGVPGVDQLGYDLVGGAIEKKGKNLNFIVTHAAQLPIGTGHEVTRFMWAFNVGKNPFRITAKMVDIGKPNPMTMDGQDRIGKANPTGFAKLEGNCETTTTPAANAINCATLAEVPVTFDAAAKTIVVEVPLKSIKAKKGSVITGGAGDNASICMICWVTHVFERSFNYTIIDSAAQAKTYKVK